MQCICTLLTFLQGLSQDISMFCTGSQCYRHMNFSFMHKNVFAFHRSIHSLLLLLYFSSTSTWESVAAQRTFHTLFFIIKFGTVTEDGLNFLHIFRVCPSRVLALPTGKSWTYCMFAVINPPKNILVILWVKSSAVDGTMLIYCILHMYMVFYSFDFILKLYYTILLQLQPSWHYCEISRKKKNKVVSGIFWCTWQFKQIWWHRHQRGIEGIFH